MDSSGYESSSDGEDRDTRENASEPSWMTRGTKRYTLLLQKSFRHFPTAHIGHREFKQLLALVSTSSI
eukprot:scaffold90310_cov48-Tisochrysis_lutea.AAC.1